MIVHNGFYNGFYKVATVSTLFLQRLSIYYSSYTIVTSRKQTNRIRRVFGSGLYLPESRQVSQSCQAYLLGLFSARPGQRTSWAAFVYSTRSARELFTP
jgi:hypothetical protein